MFNYWLGVGTLTCIYLIAILGVSILVGFTGLFSLGHAGFMAVGAYVTAIVTKNFGIPLFISIIFGTLASMLLGWVIGKATLKLKGDYFVIATLAIGECTKLVIENIPGITGGARGFTDIPKVTTFPIAFAILVVVVLMLVHFLHSKHGRNCVAIREEELAAQSVGINTTQYKMTAFLISCALCGIAGGLLAGYMGYLYPMMFTMAKSNELTMIVILGGAGSLTGTLIAGSILTPLPELLRIPSIADWRMVIYGVLVVLVVVFKPSGLMGNREFSLHGCVNQIKLLPHRIKNIGSVIKKRGQRKGDMTNE